MKKLFLFLFSTLAIANVSNFNAKDINLTEANDFEVVSSKLAYSTAVKDNANIEKYSKLLDSINLEQSKSFKHELDSVEKIFVRIFKTEKNLVPKIIKYIYFEPSQDTSEAVIREETEKILVAHNANRSAKVYINNIDHKADPFIARLMAVNKDIELYVVTGATDKDILTFISEDIEQNYPNKKEFSLIELRVMLITPGSKIKEKLALSTQLFAKKFKGVEVDDFSFLDISRKDIEITTPETRLNTYRAFIDGIY